MTNLNTFQKTAAFSLAAMVMFSSISPVMAASKKDAAISQAPGKLKQVVVQPATSQPITMPELPAQANEVATTKLVEVAEVAQNNAHSSNTQAVLSDKNDVKNQNASNNSVHGSNGTVKVGDYVLGNGPDGNPGNKPHLPCKFQIEAYGLDAGVNKVNYVVTTQAPSKPKGEIVAQGAFNLDADDNSFGASDRGYDGKVVLDLSEALKNFSAHEKQGYHVKVEVTFDGQPSNAGKHKVFWVEQCAAEVAPTPTPGQTLSTNTSKPSSEVMGTSVTRGSLPNTGGVGVAVAQALGIFLIALGGTVAWGKRVAAQCSY